MDGLAILKRLGGGRIITELGEALERMAEEVVATGKPGAVTLTLKVTPAKGVGDPNMVIVDETLARAWPKKAGRGAFFFAVEGHLHDHDPRQSELNFREVDLGRGEPRDGRGDDPSIREVAE